MNKLSLNCLFLSFALLLSGCFSIPIEFELSSYKFDTKDMRNKISNKLASESEPLANLDTKDIPADATCDQLLALHVKSLEVDGELPSELPVNIPTDDYVHTAGATCTEPKNLKTWLINQLPNDLNLLLSVNLADTNAEEKSDCQKEFQSSDKTSLGKIILNISQDPPLNITIPGVTIYVTEASFDISSQELTAENVQKWIADESVYKLGDMGDITSETTGEQTLSLDDKNKDKAFEQLLNQVGSLIFLSANIDIPTIKKDNEDYLIMPMGILTISPELNLDIDVDLGDLGCIGEI